MPENIPEQSEKELKTRFLPPWKVFILEAFLFCLTLGLGIASAFKLNEFLKTQEISLPQISFWQFLLYFLFATLFILIFSYLGRRIKKGRGFIFKAIFVLAFAWGGLITLSLWMLDIFALILIAILIFGWLRNPTVLLHNLCMIFGIAGIGSLLGLQIPPLIIVFLLIAFSVYDFIAVYKTKHMIKMAKEMIEAGAILAMIVPPRISDFLADLKEVKPGGRFLILGGGDIAFPLLLCTSLVPEGILNSSIVAIFALIGLFASFWFFISQKIRQPIPALPPIALFSIIGFLITRII